MNLPNWLKILSQVGPEILLFTPLAPIAGSVVAAIALAQGMAGATGAEKLARVTGIATEAAQATNAQAGRIVIDPLAIQAAAATSISAVVQTVKIVQAAHEQPTAPALVAVPAALAATLAP